MADLKYYDVILKPVITEKSMNAMADKTYVFLVHPDANKTMIKDAVQKMFEGVKVESQHDEYQGQEEKTRHGGRKNSGYQKAYVQLTEDSADIEIFSGL